MEEECNHRLEVWRSYHRAWLLAALKSHIHRVQHGCQKGHTRAEGQGRAVLGRSLWQQILCARAVLWHVQVLELQLLQHVKIQMPHTAVEALTWIYNKNAVDNLS